jgi:hypothetical protein
MAYWHHGSIRKYTASLLAFFNDMEIQYKLSTGETKSKKVPLVYSTREKSRVFDKVTTEQLLNGNYNVLPKANLSLLSMSKSDARITNKNNKINQFKGTDSIQFSFNSVPYEFTYDITIMCRGMNEATQLVEQMGPKFNPTVNLDIWDAENLNEPTRVPLRLMDISIESDDYDELSTNLVSVIFSLSLTGNLYPPVKGMPRVKEFQMYLNQIENEEDATRKEMMEWDIDVNGRTIDSNMDIYSDELIDPPAYTPRTIIDPNDIKTGVSLDDMSVNGLEDYSEYTSLTEILKDLLSREQVDPNAGVEGNTIDTFGYVSGSGDFDSDGNVDLVVQPRIDIYFESLDSTGIVYSNGISYEYQISWDMARPEGNISYIEYGPNGDDPLVSLAYSAEGKVVRTDYYRDRSTYALDGSGRNAYTDYAYNADGRLESSNFQEI